MYKLIFIDEEKEALDEFKDYIDSKQKQNKFEIVLMLPRESLEEMVDEIISFKPDAIITDFMLNEYKIDVKYNVAYNGVDLVKKIFEKREDFPCFVLTSFDDNAIKESDDVNIVYIKGILHGAEEKANSKANFVERIINQISHYKNKMENNEKRLLNLIRQSEERELNAFEEQEMLNLDTLIEKNLDRDSQIPDHLKGRANQEKLSELIDKVEKLNQKIEDGEDGKK